MFLYRSYSRRQNYSGIKARGLEALEVIKDISCQEKISSYLAATFWLRRNRDNSRRAISPNISV